MKIPMERKNQKGFTLMELLLTMVVIGILVSIGMGIFGTNKMFAETDGVAKLDNNIANGIMEIYDNGDFTGLTTAKVIDLGVIPSSMVRTVVATPSFIDYYQGSVSFAPVSVGGGTNNGLSILHPIVPRDRCATTVMDLAKYFNIISVGAVEVKPLNNPVFVPDLATECDKAGTKSVTVTRVP